MALAVGDGIGWLGYWLTRGYANSPRSFVPKNEKFAPRPIWWLITLLVLLLPFLLSLLILPAVLQTAEVTYRVIACLR